MKGCIIILPIRMNNSKVAGSLEKHLISKGGRFDEGKGILLNLTEGGAGRTGHVCSEGENAKRAASIQKYNLSME